MRLLPLEYSPINTGKVYVTSDIYQEYGYESVVAINIGRDHQVVAHVGLYEDLHVKNALFLDKTVVKNTKNWHEIDLNYIKVLPNFLSPSDISQLQVIKECSAIQVRIVYYIPHNVKKNARNEDFCVKNILLNMVVTEGCVFFCSPTLETNIYCIIVEKIEGKAFDAGKVTRKTSICVIDIMSEKKFLNVMKPKEGVDFDSIFLGDSEEKVRTFSKITEIVAEVLDPPPMNDFQPINKILLVGPAGAGKTSIVQAISKKIQRILITIACGDIDIQSFNEELSKILEDAKEHAKIGEPCIVLVKNIDRICKTDKSNRNRVFLNQIASQLQGVCNENISIVATTDSPENVNFLLKKVGCFSQEVELQMLTEDDRQKIFIKLSQIYGLECTEELARKIATWTPGYVLGDLLNVLRDALSLSTRAKTISESDIRKSISNTSASSLRGTRGLISTRKTTFADIGGLESVKKELRVSVLWPLAHPEAFARLGIEPTKGILLYGPPGCAKTTLIKALANESGATFLAVSSADLYSPYVGESEKRLAKLFMQARIGAPSIVFIDEIDALVGCKGATREAGVQERILATLLMEMDGVGVKINASDSLMKEGDSLGVHRGQDDSKLCDNNRIIVVGATNRPELLDDALKRPGRFDRLIHIPLPDTEERLAILKRITTNMPIADNVNLDELARRTNQFSGADLKNLCSESALFALTSRGMNVETVVFEDFCAVLSKLKITESGDVGI